MVRFLSSLAPVLLSGCLHATSPSTFATLPDDVRFPEGVAVDSASGSVFVSTFDFGPNANQLLRYDREGDLQARVDFGSTPLLGLTFHDETDAVYIANFGTAQIQRMDGDFTASTKPTVVAQVPVIGAPAERLAANADGSQDTITFGTNDVPCPNALTFGSDNTLYVSDSFQGAVYRIDNATTCDGDCEMTVVAHDPLLATSGHPPFGANGLALNANETSLYVANTGDDRVLQVDLSTGSVSVFAESIHGADGLLLDKDGTLWVAANQADQVLGLDEQGRVIEVLGRVATLDESGTHEGLLFPASLALLDDRLLVTNLALPLTEAKGDEPEEDVSRYRVSVLER